LANERETIRGDAPTRRARVVAYLALERNVVIASAAMFLLGEPARKAMIVDFAREGLRARMVGLYYLIRSITITPSAAVGGLLWKLTPQVPFVVAGLIGLVGTLVFAMTVEERYAS
jgi:hypothetical protein